jgi:hypothetical protein
MLKTGWLTSTTAGAIAVTCKANYKSQPDQLKYTLDGMMFNGKVCLSTASRSCPPGYVRPMQLRLMRGTHVGVPGVFVVEDPKLELQYRTSGAELLKTLATDSKAFAGILGGPLPYSLIPEVWNARTSAAAAAATSGANVFPGCSLSNVVAFFGSQRRVNVHFGSNEYTLTRERTSKGTVVIVNYLNTSYMLVAGTPETFAASIRHPFSSRPLWGPACNMGPLKSLILKAQRARGVVPKDSMDPTRPPTDSMVLLSPPFAPTPPHSLVQFLTNVGKGEVCHSTYDNCLLCGEDFNGAVCDTCMARYGDKEVGDVKAGLASLEASTSHMY